jgi:prophage antirepressor-like protein
MAVNGSPKTRNKGLPDEQKGVIMYDTPNGVQEMLIVSELGIYRLIFRSNRPEAEAFQDWVYSVIKSLRQSSGFEAFQVFRMLDKEHQREAMGKLRQTLSQPVRVDFIKANTIANKAVSGAFGYQKMVKKNQMTPEMLAQRQPILDDTVELMTVSEKFGLGLSVSEAVYAKYIQ